MTAYSISDLLGNLAGWADFLEAFPTEAMSESDRLSLGEMAADMREAGDALMEARISFTTLREPFPASMIGKLPRITCRACSESNSKNCGNHQKRQCAECHNYITTQHMHLDYVGHAAVTDRLNQVDPGWNWRPIRWTEDGQPAFDKNGGMWIELTVLGITRPAYGDAEGKRGADAVKAAISDAIKNGAMRFGVGIDLWSKEDLLAANPEPVEEPQRQRGKPEVAPAGEVDWLKRCEAAVDLEALREHAKNCDEAGKFVGEVKTAFLARKKEFERHLKAVKDPAAAAS